MFHNDSKYKATPIFVRVSLLFDLKPSPGSRLLVYRSDRLTEQSFLATAVPAAALKVYHGHKLAKRRWEWLATAILLDAAGIHQDLCYAPSGKPFLPDGPHLSLSHGEGLAALLLSDRPCGVDVQKPDEKLFRIRHKFCHPEELAEAMTHPDPLAFLTLLWTAKEAVFKVFGENVHFARDIRMGPPGVPASATCTRAGMTHVFPLYTVEVDGHRLTGTV